MYAPVCNGHGLGPGKRSAPGLISVAIHVVWCSYCIAGNFRQRKISSKATARQFVRNLFSSNVGRCSGKPFLLWITVVDRLCLLRNVYLHIYLILLIPHIHLFVGRAVKRERIKGSSRRQQTTLPPSTKSHVSYCAARARRREKMAAEGTSSTTGRSFLQSVHVSVVDSCHCPHPSHPSTALLPIASLSLSDQV